MTEGLPNADCKLPTIDIDPNTGAEAFEMSMALVGGLEAPSTDVLPNMGEEPATAGCEFVAAGGWLRALNAGGLDTRGAAAENRAGEGDTAARKPGLIRPDDD
jgi:hypothetical protein